jgi:hypothetical protein
MPFTEYQNRVHTLTATIANAASLSDAVELHGALVVGLVMPAAWTAAGNTGRQVSEPHGISLRASRVALL